MSDPDQPALHGFSDVFTPSPITLTRPAWFENLIRLTVDGVGRDDSLRGVVRARVEDDGGTEFRYRVARRGALVRCTSLAGKIHVIAGRDTLWTRRDDGPLQIHVEPNHGHVFAPDDYNFGPARPDAQRWRGNDFTAPAGQPREVTFLGRRAWDVELEPPPHKPSPNQTVIDAETGLLLREASEVFGTFHEWVELDTDVDLPDELFAWTDADQAAERYN